MTREAWWAYCRGEGKGGAHEPTTLGICTRKERRGTYMSRVWCKGQVGKYTEKMWSESNMSVLWHKSRGRVLGKTDRVQLVFGREYSISNERW